MIKTTLLSLVVAGSLLASYVPTFAAVHGTPCSIARQTLESHSARDGGQNYYQQQLDYCGSN